MKLQLKRKISEIIKGFPKEGGLMLLSQWKCGSIGKLLDKCFNK